MPLKNGYSHDTFEHNYQQLRHEGVALKNALAAAYDHARQSFFKQHPHGALPLWLAYPDGTRTCKSCGKRKSNPALNRKLLENIAAQMVDIGKRQDGDGAAIKALNDVVMRMNMSSADEQEVMRLYRVGLAKPDLWEHVERRRNPVLESSRSAKRSREARIQAAGDLYTRFTGHDADELVSIDKPVLPDVMLTVGDVDGILYTTVRDGKTEKYIHKFNRKCRPLFCVSHDGKQLFMLGGSYDFTERGIVDRTES